LSNKRIWCWCLEHITRIWNLLPRRQNDAEGSLKTPADVLKSLSSYTIQSSAAEKLKHARRFGCLVFHKIFPEKTLQSTWESKRQIGIHLGFSPNSSAYLVGCYMPDKRKKDGWTFCTKDTIDCVFFENVMIGQLEDLKTPEKFSNLDETCGTPATNLAIQFQTAQSGSGSEVIPQFPCDASNGEEDSDDGMTDQGINVKKDNANRKPDPETTGNSVDLEIPETSRGVKLEDALQRWIRIGTYKRLEKKQRNGEDLPGQKTRSRGNAEQQMRKRMRQW